MTARSEAVDSLKATFTVLRADLNAAVKFAKADDTAFARRALVRSLFAFIEGLTNQLSFVAAASAPLETGVFSVGELASLREETYLVNDQGKVEVRPARIPLKNRIRLALESYPRIHGSSFAPDWSDSGFTSLVAAIRIRDRLTHPKAAADLEVSDDDVRVVGEASDWYQKSLAALFEAAQAADQTFR